MIRVLTVGGFFDTLARLSREVGCLFLEMRYVSCFFDSLVIKFE